jgi:hypothetical protein
LNRPIRGSGVGIGIV